MSLCVLCVSVVNAVRYSARDDDKRRERTPGLALPRDFPFLTGQPEDIRQAFWQAMGFEAPPSR